MRLAVIAAAVIGLACKREPPAKQSVPVVVPDAVAIDAYVHRRVFEVEVSQLERACLLYEARLPLFIEPSSIACSDLAVLGCAELEKRCRTMPIGEEETQQCQRFMAHLQREVCNAEKAREHALVANPEAYLNRALTAAARACKLATPPVGRVPDEAPERAACTNIADGLLRLCETSKSPGVAAAVGKVKIVECVHLDTLAAQPEAKLHGDLLVVGTRDGFDDPDGKLACAIARALGVEC